MYMEGKNQSLEGMKFSSPEEELSFLRNEVLRKEQELKEAGKEKPREALITERVNEYKTAEVGAVLKPEYALPEKQADAIVLDLAPEEHDAKIEELIALLHEKGAFYRD